MNFKGILLTIITFSTFACAETKRNLKAETLLPLEVPSTPEQAIDHASTALLKAGISQEFIDRIKKNYISKNKNWPESALAVIEPNLYGFLYHGDYSAHNSPTARKKVQTYLRAHQNSFRAAEKKYHVSGRAIASLLWVETKLGKTMGKHPLPWVFFSLTLASDPWFCNETRKILPEKWNASKLEGKPTLQASEKKLTDRCHSKAQWAIEELKALALLDQHRKINAFETKGSFAGAFGIPQFIPSSYIKYATSDYRKKPSLFLISDAILSVGHFLSKNGWKNESAEAQASALYTYNRSKDYGSVITRIAHEL